MSTPVGSELLGQGLRASSTQISSPNDENLPPNSQSLLRVGEPLPPLKEGTCVPTQLFKSIPRGFMVHYSPADPSFPPELRNLHSDKWRNSKFLKTCFPMVYIDRKGQERVKKDYKTCPFSILHLASDVDDRMILYNWWIQLKQEKMDETIGICKQIFVRYTVDSELAPMYNPDNPKITFITDSVEMRKKHVESTKSHKLLNSAVKRKHASSPPRTNPQLRDAHVKKAEGQCQQQLRSIFDRTKKCDSYPAVNGSFEPILLTTSNVYSPPKRGGRPNPDLRPQPKHQAIARNPSVLHNHILDVVTASKRATEELKLDRNPTADEILKFLHYDCYYYDDDGCAQFPGEVHLSESKQPSIRTVRDISNDSSNTDIETVMINLDEVRFDSDVEEDGMED